MNPIIHRLQRSSTASGFSLIELLIVIALIAVLSTATLPALRGISDGFSLRGGGDMLSAELSNARLTAMARNSEVEVRFYYDKDSANWKMISSLITATYSGKTSDEWLTPARYLPGNVIIDPSTNFSSLLNATGGSSSSPTSGTEGTSAPRKLQNQKYVAFRFMPNGSTDLDASQSWCLVLKDIHSSKSNNDPGLPASNFVAVTIDAQTGRPQIYQP